MAVLGYLPKLKRSLEQVFVAHFLHDFSNKISLFNTLSNDEVSMAYLFSSQDIKQNVLWSQDLSSIILESSGQQGKKVGKTKIRKFENVENENFLHKIKSSFHNYLRAIF